MDLPLRRLETNEGSILTNIGHNPITDEALPEAGGEGVNPEWSNAIGRPFYPIHRRPSHEQDEEPSPTVSEVLTTQLLPTFHFSKDLFVRAVYFDSRPRDGHRNTSVFLVVCLKSVTDNNLIIGCQVDGKKADKFSVNLIGETPLWRAFYPSINHEEVIVHCYDLPAHNGSSAHIAYKRNVNDQITLAASERPYVIPAPRIDPSSADGKHYNMTIVSCAKIFERPPWLKEWLTYQRTLGVDHVHLDAEDSFLRTEIYRQQFLVDMIAEGFVSIDVWKKYLSSGEIWYHNQGLIYEDCPYRFRGTYDYIVHDGHRRFLHSSDPNRKKAPLLHP